MTEHRNDAHGQLYTVYGAHKTMAVVHAHAEGGGCWYVATPYSQYPEGIGEAFLCACEASAILIRGGFRVFAPIVHSHPIAVAGDFDPLDHSIWMRQDEPMVANALGMIVVMMTGWAESKGIAQEIKDFEAAGKPVFYMGWSPPNEVEDDEPEQFDDLSDAQRENWEEHEFQAAGDICLEAADLVTGPRNGAYGDIYENHANIAAFWSDYLGMDDGAEITARDVALMMALMKIARSITGQFNPDHYVDLAGYAGCAGEIASKEHEYAHAAESDAPEKEGPQP